MLRVGWAWPIGRAVGLVRAIAHYVHGMDTLRVEKHITGVLVGCRPPDSPRPHAPLPQGRPAALVTFFRS